MEYSRGRCRVQRSGLVWENVGRLRTSRAAVFWMSCRGQPAQEADQLEGFTSCRPAAVFQTRDDQSLDPHLCCVPTSILPCINSTLSSSTLTTPTECTHFQMSVSLQMEYPVVPQQDVTIATATAAPPRNKHPCFER